MDNQSSRPVRVELDERGRLGGPIVITGHVRDLSAAGMFIACDQTMPPGTELDVEFELPLGDGNKGRVSARAEVRHRGNAGLHGVGLRFLRLPFESHAVIRGYLAAQAGH